MLASSIGQASVYLDALDYETGVSKGTDNYDKLLKTAKSQLANTQKTTPSQMIQSEEDDDEEGAIS